jgi:hypothetical protein
MRDIGWRLWKGTNGADSSAMRHFLGENGQGPVAFAAQHAPVHDKDVELVRGAHTRRHKTANLKNGTYFGHPIYGTSSGAPRRELKRFSMLGRSLPKMVLKGEQR